jgi:hypothetical protein
MASDSRISEKVEDKKEDKKEDSERKLVVKNLIIQNSNL